MSLDLLLLFLLTFTGGLFYAWLGAGAGAILVPLLPYVSSLDALGAVQASLLMGFLISCINSLVFQFQKLILWSWVLKALFFIITASFLAGFSIGFLSAFQIRAILWSFFLFILLFPFILNSLKLNLPQEEEIEREHKKSKFSSIFSIFPFFSRLPSFLLMPSFPRKRESLRSSRFLRSFLPLSRFFKSGNSGKNQPQQTKSYKMRFFYLCNILAGFSSGLTGVGGGMILSPFFHESRLIPSKNIPAVASFLLLCVTGFSLLGQITQNSLSLTGSSEIFLVCLQILPGYFLGSVAGYIVNNRQNNPQLRRQIIRFLVLILFLKMTLEILSLLFH